VAELIRSLNDRGNLGYYGHHQFAQVLGYLVVDQNRAEMMARPIPKNIPALEDAERKLLAGVHNQIVRLNEQCVAPLTGALPKCAIAVDPYNTFSYAPLSEINESDLLTPEAIRLMAESFHNHPQIAIALASAEIVPEEVTPQEHAQQVLGMREEFLKAGARESPKWLVDIIYRQRENLPRRIYTRHIAALLSVRESLAALNQLIYQKIFDDKLVELSDDYIIKLVSYGPYGGLRIIYQNAGLLSLTEVGDLIFANFTLSGDSVKELCRVDYLENILADIGAPQYAEFRMIDENLNPYGALLREL
jgi:hypothetical protein